MKIQQQIKATAKDVLGLFYPQICVACSSTLQKAEKSICLHCHHRLPKTDFHTFTPNTIEKIFHGRVELQAAAAYLYFRKSGRVQKLMHNIKYRGTKEAAEELGKLYGKDLLKNSIFKSVDVVVPVPLHSEKLKKRGYNQSEWFAKGIAAAMNKPLDTEHFKRTFASETQTRKSRFERWQNVAEIFKITLPDYFAGKHVLLVDDVVTTGATLEACALSLLNDNPQTKISIITLAYAV